jgi:hypothetical protein
MLNTTRYIVQVQEVVASESPRNLAISSSATAPRENVDTSELIQQTEYLLDSLTADTLQDGDQQLDLGEVYSVGYGLNYAQNRANLTNAKIINLNGGIVTKGFVGDNTIELPKIN